MTITIKVGGEPKTQQDQSIKMSLKVRKTMDGQIMVMDHNEIDIVIAPGIKKIIVFPKTSFHDTVYACQDRFFNFLAQKGTIKRETVQSGNVYGSMEAEYPDAVGNVDSTQLILFTIGKFFEEEKPHMEIEEYYEKEFEEKLTDPDEEESTELGEIEQSPKKGTLDATKIRRYLTPFGPY